MMIVASMDSMFIKRDREHIRQDAVKVIDSISEKFQLYSTHQTRCECQQSAISKIDNNIKELCV